MNIAEILKNCPQGTKLYSLVHGEVSLLCVNMDCDDYPIVVKNINDTTTSFTQDGRFLVECDGECMLFPSKENRNWSTFEVPKKEYNFKPYDKVLVRNYSTEWWYINFFSHITNKERKYECLHYSWKYCIPYEGNEHLVGTTNSH